jgi:hypothetical protein
MHSEAGKDDLMKFQRTLSVHKALPNSFQPYVIYWFPKVNKVINATNDRVKRVNRGTKTKLFKPMRGTLPVPCLASWFHLPVDGPRYRLSSLPLPATNAHHLATLLSSDNSDLLYWFSLVQWLSPPSSIDTLSPLQVTRLFFNSFLQTSGAASSFFG